MFLPYFASSLSGIFYGVTESLNKNITEEKYSPFSYAFLQYFLNTLIFLIPAVFFLKLPATNITYLYLTICISITLVANALTIKAYKTEDISFMSILSSVTLVTTVIIGNIFLAEELNTFKISGIIMIILGIFVIFYEGKKLVVSKGLLIALVAKIIWGIEPLFDKLAVTATNTVTFILIIQGTLTFTHLFIPSIRKEAGIILKKNLLKIFLSRIAVTGGLFLFLWSIQRGNISIVNTNCDTLFLLSTVFIGIIFLQERKHIAKKLAGSLLCTLGIILLNFF